MREAKALIDPTASVEVSGASFAGQGAHLPLLLSFSPELPAILPVNGLVAYVNPASGHIAEATALLEVAVRHVEHAHRATLSPAYGEPEIDLAAWQRADEALALQIELLEARVSAGDTSSQAELDTCLATRDALPGQLCLISQDSLNWYRSHNNCVMFAMTGELDEIDLESLIEQCIQQGDSAVALAQAVEKKAAMRRSEQ